MILPILKNHAISLILLIGLFLTGCEEPTQEFGTQHTSDDIEFGNGYVNLWVEKDTEDSPFRLLALADDIILINPPEEETSVTLPWPDDVDPIAPYRHFRFYYLPDGHGPPGLDIPQFKLRAYLIDEQKREDLKDADEQTRIVTPNDQLLPEGFELLNRGDLPPVGSQWVNPNLNDLEGNFQYAYAWGFNDGELIYLETMLSLEVLTQRPDAVLEVAQPNAVQREGYYPFLSYISFSNGTNQFFMGMQEFGFRTSN